jgi:hypothetical protein
LLFVRKLDLHQVRAGFPGAKNYRRGRVIAEKTLQGQALTGMAQDFT